MSLLTVQLFCLQDVRVLGSTVDDLTGVLYFYVWTSRASETGVYAYDKRSVLSPNGGLIKIYTSEMFNFPPDGFVKGDIVYKKERNRPQDSTIPDVDSLLYFTDNVNEPRKLDVYRALFADDMPTLAIPKIVTRFMTSSARALRSLWAMSITHSKLTPQRK